MIELRFFARYREALGCEAEQLPYDPALSTVGELRAALIARGGAWQVLGEGKVMCARNQDMCSMHEPLADGDEIAFFPPVTGG